MMKEVTKEVIYIGVDDTDLDLFESQYEIPEGVSYNSYVILDEKTALMDTVDHRKTDEWLANLKEALAGRSLDYVVVQHLEPDHSGSLEKVLELYPEAQVITSVKSTQMMAQFIDADLSNRMTGVKEGEELNLGTHTLQFFMAPMVHWPEVMFTYDNKDKVLFSADGFGKFGALCNEDDDWACEARRYYFNICGKYGMPVQTILKKAANLDIEIIAPLHGPVLTENLGYYIGLYDTWSKFEAETKGVFIAVASIHGNTLAAAEKFADMLRERGEEKVVVSEISRSDIAECIEDAFRYDRIVLAASSYDGGVFLPMQDFLTHLQYKLYQNRKVGIIENGSWGPTAARAIQKSLDTMKNIEVFEPIVTIMTRLKDSNMKDLEALADAVVAGGKN